MPTDVRKLIFTNAELREIFKHYVPDAGIATNGAELFGVKVEPHPDREDGTPGLRAILSYPTGDPLRPFLVRLNATQICDALVSACRASKIPLPMKSKKYVQISNDGISLTTGMASVPVRYAPLPSASREDNALDVTPPDPAPTGARLRPD